MIVPENFHTGDKVAWTMIDGNVMTGEIIYVGFSNLYITRIDGTEVIIARDKVRFVTEGEFNKALEFFQN